MPRFGAYSRAALKRRRTNMSFWRNRRKEETPNDGCAFLATTHQTIQPAELVEEVEVIATMKPDSAFEVSEEILAREEREFPELKVIETPEIQMRPEMPKMRLVNIGHFVTDLLASHRSMEGCTAEDFEYAGETKCGLSSYLTFKCKVCRLQRKVTTTADHHKTNLSAVTSALTAGLGFSAVNEFFSGMNIPFMSEPTFFKDQSDIDKEIHRIAVESMLEAGREELALAVARGDVTPEGYGLITVVADGMWAKRSYRTNYNALSGMATIIGWHTKKVLFVGKRNKYCSQCQASQKSGITTPHNCVKNWDKSSTSMEADIIAEGFMNSIKDHNLIYKRLVGDGDSSVRRRLEVIRPYGDLRIQKVECYNHLNVNLHRKLEENVKGCDSTLKAIVPRILKGVASATKHWIEAENVSFEEKKGLLTHDIKNAYLHALGDHEKCSDYFCKKKDGNDGLLMASNDLKENLKRTLTNHSHHADSLIVHATSNTCEEINALCAKQLMGKRILFKKSFNTRIDIGVVRRNQPDEVHSEIHRAVLQNSPGSATKKYDENMVKRRIINEKSNGKKASRKLFGKAGIEAHVSAGPDADYGLADQVPREKLEAAGDEMIAITKLTNREREDLEERTRDQAESDEWHSARRVRLCASSFGDVVVTKPTTSTRNKVFHMLYGQRLTVKALQHGKYYEPVAMEKFEEQSGLTVAKCGLFVHKELPFLAATPDGLVGDDELLEIKCPYAAYETGSMEEAIRLGKLEYCEIDYGGSAKLKRTHKYYYQIQGQMAIAEKSKTHFFIFTKNWTHSELITRNTEMWNLEMVPKLEWFYRNAMAPELLYPMYPSNTAAKSKAIREALVSWKEHDEKKILMFRRKQGRTKRHPTKRQKVCEEETRDKSPPPQNFPLLYLGS